MLFFAKIIPIYSYIIELNALIKHLHIYVEKKRSRRKTIIAMFEFRCGKKKERFSLEPIPNRL